ncbi:MAG: T9SS type A sorting domain-containing protein [Flavobacteriales bacterium]|nr:T9SS type A sorting domain-containing protein [Flavobacteriales bacterium]
MLIFIIHSQENSDRSQLVLQDLLGNTVMTIAEGTQKAGTYTVECNTEGLSSGMYRLVLTTATGTISTPMVIQR